MKKGSEPKKTATGTCPTTVMITKTNQAIGSAPHSKMSYLSIHLYAPQNGPSSRVKSDPGVQLFYLFAKTRRFPQVD